MPKDEMSTGYIKEHHESFSPRYQVASLSVSAVLTQPAIDHKALLLVSGIRLQQPLMDLASSPLSMGRRIRTPPADPFTHANESCRHFGHMSDCTKPRANRR